MTTENDDQVVVLPGDVREGVNPLDKLCADITNAWAALHETHKDDPATRDIVEMGLLHTGQLVGAVQTLQLALQSQPGPTGEHPQGQLNEDDNGELRIQVGHKDGNVIVDFGTPVAWLALSFDEVPNLTNALMVHAQAAGEEMVDLDAMRDEDPNGES